MSELKLTFQRFRFLKTNSLSVSRIFGYFSVYASVAFSSDKTAFIMPEIISSCMSGAQIFIALLTILYALGLDKTQRFKKDNKKLYDKYLEEERHNIFCGYKKANTRQQNNDRFL